MAEDLQLGTVEKCYARFGFILADTGVTPNKVYFDQQAVPVSSSACASASATGHRSLSDLTHFCRSGDRVRFRVNSDEVFKWRVRSGSLEVVHRSDSALVRASGVLQVVKPRHGFIMSRGGERVFFTQNACFDQAVSKRDMTAQLREGMRCEFAAVDNRDSWCAPIVNAYWRAVSVRIVPEGTSADGGNGRWEARDVCSGIVDSGRRATKKKREVELEDCKQRKVSTNDDSESSSSATSSLNLDSPGESSSSASERKQRFRLEGMEVAADVRVPAASETSFAEMDQWMQSFTSEDILASGAFLLGMGRVSAVSDAEAVIQKRGQVEQVCITQHSLGIGSQPLSSLLRVGDRVAFRARRGEGCEVWLAQDIKNIDFEQVSARVAELGTRKKLFVGSLSSAVSTEMLRRQFSRFGPVREAMVVRGRDFGFVEFKEARHAKACLQWRQPILVCGQQVRVSVATPKDRFQAKAVQWAFR